MSDAGPGAAPDWENLAHQLLLVSLGRGTGRMRHRRNLSWAVAAGALAELALQERVQFAFSQVIIADPRPTQDPLPDLMLQLLGRRTNWSPMQLIDAAPEAFLGQTLAELLANHWVRLATEGVTSAGSYRVIDETRLARAQELARAGFQDPDHAPRRASHLAGLVYEAGLSRTVAPEIGALDRLAAAWLLGQRSWVIRGLQDLKHYYDAGEGLSRP